MKKSSRYNPGLRAATSRVLLGACLTGACALLSGCLFGRAPTAYELDPTEKSSAPRDPLPDEAERAAAQLLTWSLDDSADPGVARGLLQQLQALDAEQRARGERGSGLVDNALDAYNATRGEDAFREFAEEMLKNGKPDPALERKLRSYFDSQPLRVAQKRLAQQSRRKYGMLFNRVVGPLLRGFAGDPTAALEGGRALIYSYAVLRSTAQATTQERQALRAYNEFLEKNPGSPESARISAEVQKIGRKLREQRLREALRAARDAMAAGRPDAALIHVTRAEQISPEDPRTQAVRQTAEAELFLQEQRVRITLAADADRGSAFASLSGGSQEPMVAELLEDGPLPDFKAMHGNWGPVDADLQDEMAFIEASEKLTAGDEDGYFAELGRLAQQPGNMARHAASALESPEQNPYAVYKTTRRTRSRQLTRWLFIGSIGSSDGPRGLPLPLRALNTVFEAPYYALTLVSLPLRALQYRSVKAKASSPVIDAGELYLSRFPKGEHAPEIHRALESAYVDRKLWGKALEHHAALAGADEGTTRYYREKIASRTLEYAQLPERPLNVRMAVYVSLVKEFGDTASGKKAGLEIEKLRKSMTPQSIRLTKQFLVENREVWGPGALGLRPELLDGKRDNGELSDDGLRLIGRSYIELELEDRDPVQRKIPEENFVRFVSLLEEVRYRKMADDGREKPQPDAQLDLFLERARLGLADQSDRVATERSESVMMSAGEKFGGMKRADTILPIELVVRGGLSDAGLGALPRIKIPDESEDAFLYK